MKMETKPNDVIIKKLEDHNGNTIAVEVGRFPIRVIKKERYWSAYSPYFKTFGHSKKNADDAIEDLKKSLDTFFSVHIERGTLEKALFKLGWEKIKNNYVTPKLFNTPTTRSNQRLMQYA